MILQTGEDIKLMAGLYDYLWKDYQKLCRKKRILPGFKKTIAEYNWKFIRMQKVLKSVDYNATFPELKNPNSFVEES